MQTLQQRGNTLKAFFVLAPQAMLTDTHLLTVEVSETKSGDIKTLITVTLMFPTF